MILLFLIIIYDISNQLQLAMGIDSEVGLYKGIAPIHLVLFGYYRQG